MAQALWAQRRTETGTAALAVGPVVLVADPAGVLWHEPEGLLIVADLHLEKGSAYAERRVFLPPYDTAATLMRLAALIERYRPRAVAALGDSFHDVRAGARMEPTDRDTLRALQVGRDWIWIAGNHDPEVPRAFGVPVAEMRVGSLVLRHEPRPGVEEAEIAGHLHPVARVVSPAGSGSVRRRCFVGDGNRCVLPAFGAFTGGLNIRDVAFAALFSARPRAHVMGRSAVYVIDMGKCVGE